MISYDEDIFVSQNAIRDTNMLDDINTKMKDFLKEKNTTFKRTDNCLHHILVYDKYILNDILDIIANEPCVKEYFKTGFIMHSCGAVINKPNKQSYPHHWHVDTYEPENDKMMLNVLVPLCDFTKENGCTKIFPKNSKKHIDILLKTGDILFFNSGLMHCTGENTTSQERNCLTITLVKMYMKPQFNYLSLFTDKEIEQMSPTIKRLINYDSNVVSNLQDFYNKKSIFIEKK